jgi:poly(A) polymerase
MAAERVNVENGGPRRSFAVDVVRRLRDAGFRALWAGGCVRDLLLGLDPADYDVATDATPEQVMGLFRRTTPVGVSFGVVRVRGPHDAGEVEVATFRSDGAYVDGRRPESVRFSSPEEDASRRDFTINGMFLDPVSGDLFDFVGGQADLRAKRLRAIGDPSARFGEDKLRLLRAVRFAARFQLEIEPTTWDALVARAEEIRVVAAERIAQEMRRLLVHPTRIRGMDLAIQSGLLESLLPELLPMRGLFCGEPVQPTGDLWEHTLHVLEKLPDEPTFPLALAALLHDVGKPRTKRIEDGVLTFAGYERAGRETAEEISRRLKLSNSERERTTWLVEHHRDLVDATQLRESRLKRILASAGIKELLALHRADALATIGNASQVDYCDGTTSRASDFDPDRRSTSCSNSSMTLSSNDNLRRRPKRSNGSLGGWKRGRMTWWKSKGARIVRRRRVDWCETGSHAERSLRRTTRGTEFRPLAAPRLPPATSRSG